MPDFSDTMRIFTVIVVAEIMVVVYSLSFFSFEFAYWNRLAVLSLMAQLIAISVIVLLSAWRSFFNRFHVLPGVLLVLLMTLLLASSYTWFLTWIDDTLMFGLVSDHSFTTLKISVATGMTLLALLRYFYVQEQWSRQVEAVANAQMNALQARIKPHFLYNSLNSIASLVSIDPGAAEKAVLNLSGLFRKAFSNHHQSMTTLAKEIEWIEEYLAIEKLRLVERLDFKVDVDAALLEQTVPLLSIQPLVENAVIHGIQHLTAGGVINIEAKTTDQGFRVKVSNPYRPEKVKPGNQTGLENIRQRLLLTYGEQVVMGTESGELFNAYWEVKL